MTRRITAAVLAVALALSVTADAAQAPAPTAPGTPQSVTDTLLSSGAAKLQNGIWWAEFTSAATAASTTYSGVYRSNVASGSPSPFGYFQVVVLSSQSGTLSINEGNFNFVAAQSITAGVPYIAKVPAFGGSFQAVFVNNATAGTLSMKTGFTAD